MSRENPLDVTGPAKMCYKSIQGADLHLHVFRPKDIVAGKKAPGIVFFHCGGHRRFEAGQFFPQSAYLAARGMVCFDAEVRVNPLHGTGPAECVTDAKSAIRYVRQHADALGVDAGRIAAGGGSAAGHVAACCGIVEGFEEPGEDHAVGSIPDALILWNPALDYSDREDRFERFGGPDAARAMSPTPFVSRGNPPALVMHGKADEVVDAAQAIAFDRAMRAAGNRCELRLYDDAPHGFFNYRDGKNAWFYETLREADTFLASLGYLDEGECVDGFAFTAFAGHTWSPIA